MSLPGSISDVALKQFHLDPLMECGQGQDGRQRSEVASVAGAKKCQEGPLEGCPMAAAPVVSKVVRILLSRVRDANCRG